MNKYTQPPITSQALPLTQANIYQSLLYNFNKPKHKQEIPTKSFLADACDYALTTTRDALQALAKRGLIYFNWVLRCWVLRIAKQKVKDTYDAYIKYKQDMKDKSINYNIYLFGIYESKRILGGNL